MVCSLQRRRRRTNGFGGARDEIRVSFVTGRGKKKTFGDWVVESSGGSHRWGLHLRLLYNVFSLLLTKKVVASCLSETRRNSRFLGAVLDKKMTLFLLHTL